MKFLIDGDTPLYRAAAAAQHNTYYIYPKGEEEHGYCASFRYKKDANAWMGEYKDQYTIETELEVEPEYAAIHNIRSIMSAILSTEGIGDHEIFLGGDGNYRYSINPEYKAGRREKPHHYNAVKRCLVEEFGAQIVEGMEADDAVSIEQYRSEEETCIVTVDKDLDMVPGWHYNWVKQDMYFITEDEADVNFYIQLLTGDRTDNIHGLHGVGPVTAKKYLEAANTPYERYQVVVGKYDDAGRDDLEAVARQIWMSKNEPNDWSPPE
jgi:hypothetical protein